MKLPRYSSTALPRLDIISPRQAGAAAAAKSGFLAGAARTAARGFEIQHAVNMKIEAAEDKAVADEEKSDAERRVKEWESNPVYDLDVQEDGTETPLQMATDRDELIGELRKSGANIKHSGRRETFQRQLNASIDLVAIDMDNKINKRRIGIAHDKTIDSIHMDAQNRNYDVAIDKINQGAIDGLWDAEKKIRMTKLVEGVRVDQESEALASEVFDAFQDSEDEGEKKLEWIAENVDDEEIRNKALSLGNTARVHWGKIRAGDLRKQEQEFIHNYRGDVRAARAAGWGGEAAWKKYEAGGYGDPESPQAAQRLQSVLDAEFQYKQTASKVRSIDAEVNGGYYVEDTMEVRKLLDALEQERLGDAPEGADPLEIRAELFRSAGTISHSANVRLSHANKSPEALMTVYAEYAAYISDQDEVPNMHLTGDSEYALESMHQMVQGGISPLEASVTAFDAMHVDKTARDARLSTLRTEENQDIVTDNFDTYVQGRVNQYEPLRAMVGLAATPSVDPIVREHYDATLRKVMEATGSISTAEAMAQRGIDQSFKMTNINGEWEMQKHGLEGDVTEIRDVEIQSLMDMPGYVWIKADGEWGPHKITDKNKDRVTFIPELIQDNPDGLEMGIYFDGNRVSRAVSETETEIAKSVLQHDIVTAYATTSKQRADLVKVDKELERLDGLLHQADRRAAGDIDKWTSFTGPDRADRWRKSAADLKNQKAFLEGQIDVRIKPPTQQDDSFQAVGGF